MADGKNITKSGGAIAGRGVLFLAPNNASEVGTPKARGLMPLEPTTCPPDAWDHFAEEIELLAIHTTVQQKDVQAEANYADSWDWNDPYDVTVIEGGAQNVDSERNIEDPWDHWAEEIELGYIPGSFQRESTDPCPEDPWLWDDAFYDDVLDIIDDDDDAVGPDAPVATAAPEEAWYWDDDSSELEDFGTEPLGANVDRPPDEIEWPWADGQEFDDELFVSDSAPVGANVAPVPEDPPWDWSEYVEEDAAIDFDQPIGADVDPVQEDPWYWDDGFDDEAAVDLDQPIGANVAPTPEDPWDWSEFPDDDAVYTYDSAPVGPNVDPVQEDPWYWDDSFDDEAGIDFDQPIGANVDPVQEDAWDWWNEYPTEDDQLDFDQPQPIDFVAPSYPVEDPWDWSEFPDDDASIDFDAPIGANVDPIQEDPWLWDDSFDDEAAVDLDQPVGANVAPVPEDPIWDWSENVSDDDAFDLAQPVGANVTPSPDDIEWPWADGHELDEEWPFLTFDSQPVGADVAPSPEDPWEWGEWAEDDWDLGSDAIATPDALTFPHEWDWEEAEDAWHTIIDDDDDAVGPDAPSTDRATDELWQWEEVEDEWTSIIDDDDDAVGANAPAGASPDDPWDWWSEEIETLVVSGSAQNDQAIQGSPVLCVEDAWDHFAEEIALVAIPGTKQESIGTPPSVFLANSDENFHFYIGDVEHFHADHFDNYDSDNLTYSHEWHWEEVEDESFFGTDPIRVNAPLFAPAPDEPWPHFEDPLGDQELEFDSAPVGRDLEPVPADAWEWTEDTGDELAALVALDQPQPPPEPAVIEDAWPWWDDTGEETGDFETTASDFDISVSPIAIDDPWRWYDDEVDESPLFAALDAIDNTPIPPSGPPEDPPWDWSEQVEDHLDPDRQHLLIDIVPDVPAIGDDSGQFDWPAEDSLGDDPSLFGNGPVGPDGCPACPGGAKRWFGPTFVKFLQ